MSEEQAANGGTSALGPEKQSPDVEEHAITPEERVSFVPSIRATFDLDESGMPTAVEAGNRKHYRIKLHVDGAPPDTYAVTYVLDPTYLSPVREVRNTGDFFEEELFSYGDYTVQAKIRSRDGVMTVAVPLARALAESYEQPSRAITSAIHEIAAK
jgi:hypothetical protein